MNKKLLSFLVALYCVASNISAQNSDTFINAFESKKAVWTYISCAHCSPAYRSIQKTIVHGDTLIDGSNWKFVTEDRYDGIMMGIQFVRTNGKKVLFQTDPNMTSCSWFDDPNNTKDSIVIYDFSLEVGDMTRGDGGFPFMIEEIDSIVLNDGHKHKRIAGNYVEGLGSATAPPFFHLSPVATGHYGHDCELVCCQVDDELLYINPKYADDYEDIIAGILSNNERIESNLFKVFVENRFLNIVLNETGFFDLAIFNMNGLLLKQQSKNTNEAKLQLSDFTKGVYIVHITYENKTHSRKIIIN